MDVAYHGPGWKRIPTRPFLSAGYTLAELLTTVAIVGTLASIAAPSFAELIADTRLSTQFNSLVASLNLARSEAIKRTTDVVVCKSSDQNLCIREGGWEQGWLVFVDKDRSRTRDESETLIHVQDSLDGQITVQYSAFGSQHYIIYYPEGFSRTNGTFTFCDPRGADKAKALILYKTGRLRNDTARPDGEPLSCPTG